MLAGDVALVVLDEIKNYLPGEFERNGHELEALLLKDGRAIDPIVYWVQDEKMIVVDGHRRLDICTRHKLPFEITEKKFDSMRDLKHWMDCNQSSRRNLTGHERAMLIGRMDTYLEEEKLSGRFTGAIDEEIAKARKVSTRQVHRDKQHADDLEKLAETIRPRVMSGELKISVADLREFASLPQRNQLDLVAQVDKGEFGSLGEAVTGIVSSAPAATFDPVTPESGKTHKKPAKHRQVDPTRPLAAKEAAALEEPADAPVPLPGPVEARSSIEVVDAAIKALGMFSKAMDELNELAPNPARKSSVTSHISNLRAVLKNWAREAA